jgi:hypothetical protein
VFQFVLICFGLKHCLLRIGLVAMDTKEYCAYGSNVALFTLPLLFAMMLSGSFFDKAIHCWISGYAIPKTTKG